MSPHCDPCGVDCTLKTGRDVYPHRADLADVRVWVCPSCSARVGCHPGTSKPLGNPASAELRRARMILHDQRLDPLWRYAPRKHGKQGRRRALVYKYLAHKLGIDASVTHTGMFDLERCREAWRVLCGVTFEDIERFQSESRERIAAQKED